MSADQTHPGSFQGLDSRGVIDHPPLLQLLRQSPFLDILGTSTIIKKDRKRQVAVIRIDDSQEIFVKVYFDRGWLDRIRSALFNSRALRSHNKALALSRQGLPTPTPIGYADFKTRSHSGSAQFTSFLTGGKTLTEALDSPQLHQYWVDLGFEQLSSLHSHGFVHGDLKLNNQMILNQRLYYIDIDSAAQTTDTRARAKDLARFMVALSEANVALEHVQKAFGKYCDTLGLNEQKLSMDIKHIAHRIQHKHLLKYQRPSGQIL